MEWFGFQRAKTFAGPWSTPPRQNVIDCPCCFSRSASDLLNNPHGHGVGPFPDNMGNVPVRIVPQASHLSQNFNIVQHITIKNDKIKELLFDCIPEIDCGMEKDGEKPRNSSIQRCYIDFAYTGGQCQGWDKEDTSLLSGLSKPKPLSGTFNNNKKTNKFVRKLFTSAMKVMEEHFPGIWEGMSETRQKGFAGTIFKDNKIGSVILISIQMTRCQKSKKVCTTFMLIY